MDAHATTKQLRPSKRLQVTSILKRYRSAADLNDPLFPSRGLTPEVDISLPPGEEVTRVLNLVTACRSGKLGSHVFDCEGCQRTLVGLNRCTNRHCPACSHTRRQAWQTAVSEWAPRCSYWHIVFTLPHDLNPLLKANEAVLFRLFGTCCSQVLERIARRELHCQPGLISALHTWGQRMNYHVHQHIILTAGGLSLDGNGWIELSHHHPALHERTLADQLRTTFLRRLRGRLKRGELVWPAEEIGMSQEAFFEGMSRKPWIASSQSPTIQTGDDAGQAADGAQGIVHYLAAYVSGTAIGNGRIIDDDGQMVRFQFKDYRTGKVGIEKLTGVEFTRRFCQHVWPKSIRKVRYGGLFAARGRVERMVRCNELISQSVAATTGVAQDNQASTDSKFSGDLDTSGDIEEAPTMTGCRCRYCQGPLAVTCRLKGLPTQRLMSLVAAITGLLPALSEQVIATLKTNLPCTPRELKRIRRQCLPSTVADVMSGLTLDYEHSHALFAFIDWAQESWRTASMLPFKPP